MGLIHFSYIVTRKLCFTKKGVSMTKLKTYTHANLINYDDAIHKLDVSLKSAEDFAELTDDFLGIIEKKRQMINELKDILTYLTWMFGRKHIFFYFGKRKFNDNVVPLTEVLNDSDLPNYEHWNKRIRLFVYKKDEKPVAIVYIFY